MHLTSLPRLFAGRTWQHGHAFAGLTTLLTTTAVWSYASAQLQQNNADQLVNAFLFSDSHVLSGASFPASHTQLIKWPLFWLPHFFGSAPWSFLSLTVLLAVVTIAFFAYLLYRLVHRKPLLFGSLCFLLASVLVLVPVFTADVTTPLGLAQLTGRNIEYVMYIVALVLLLKAGRYTTWLFGGATALLALLLASDHLFAWFALGGSSVLVAVSWLFIKKELQAVATRWLVSSVIAWVAAVGLQVLIGHTFTHIVSDPSGLAPIHTASLLRQGMSGTLQALALNFGISLRYGYWSLLAVLCNVVSAGLILIAGIYLVRTRIQPSGHLNTSQGLSVLLLATSVVAILGFMVINQPYSGDARYLTIVLFSGFIVLAHWASNNSWHARQLVVVGVVAGIVTLIGLPAVLHNDSHYPPTSQLRADNLRVVSLLKTHPVEYLVGYYWRVVPIKELAPQARLSIVPLSGCVSPLQVLNSTAWRPQLLTHSFAYLLETRPAATPGISCRLQQITFLYGPPTAIVAVSGTSHNPSEELLFYEHGASIHRDAIRLCRQDLCLERQR